MRPILASLLLVAAGCTGGAYTGAPSGGDDTTTPPATDDTTPPDEDVPPPTGRVMDGIVALYEFEEGLGPVIHDTSNVGEPLDLTVSQPGLTTWQPTGLRIDASNIIRSGTPATKIIDACTASSEITIEAWVTPASTDTGGIQARIAGVSVDTQARNFSLLQTNVDYEARLRTGATELNGTPATVASGQVTTEPQHVLYTRDAAGQARIYVNGAEAGLLETPDTFANWDTTYELALANEITLNRPWLGTLHLVAIYCRALNPGEVQRNYVEGY